MRYEWQLDLALAQGHALAYFFLAVWTASLE
jgi:hypothetical protein